MLRRVVLACIALSGCDTVFGVDALYVCEASDEDCDELRDDIDPCPADPGSTEDQDGDGIGDDCDPNIALPVDEMLEIETFSTADARWIARTDTAAWRIANGALELDDGAVERPTPANRQPSVELYVAPSFRNEGAIVGAFVASKSATGVPLECRVEHHANGDDLVMLVGEPGKETVTEVGRATNLRGSHDDVLRIYGSQLTDFKVRCLARYGANDALYVEWEHFMMPADFDTIGFRVSNASAAYRTLAIYTRNP